VAAVPDREVSFRTRPGRLVRAGVGALVAFGAAAAILPLALVGLPLMTSVAVAILVAYGGHLLRAVLRERSSACPPRLALGPDGVRLRSFGGVRVQELSWGLVGGLRIDGRRLVVELAPGKRMRGGRPLTLDLGDLPEGAPEAILEVEQERGAARD